MEEFDRDGANVMHIDAVDLEVVKASLSGIVQEMQNSLFRTGFSTIVRESQDASCALMNEAGEVVATVQTAMLAGLPYSGLRDAVLAHPTMAEGLDPLLSNVPARSPQSVTPKSTVLTA